MFRTAAASQSGMLANGSESGRHERPSRIRECGEAMADAQSTNGRSKQPEGQQRGGRGGFAGSGKLADANEPGLQGRLGAELSECGSQRIAWRAVHGTGQTSLPDPESNSTNGNRRASLKLSADWVEALMDVPAMWTDCVCSATASIPQPQPEPLSPCIES
jgi:hypothetical protein